MPASLRIGRLLALVLALAGCGRGSAPSLHGKERAQALIHQARDRVYPALVMISASWNVYQGGTVTRAGGTGSGTIIDPIGHVLTNFHVAGSADVIHCQLYNKEMVKARLVGADPWTDVALLQLDMDEVQRKAPGVTWATLGHSGEVQVGDLVLAMGAPLAQARSVSFGVVSNTDRTLPEGFRLPTGEETGSFNVWIQTDASINPGNSGGPLVDMNGKVVGMNSRGMPNADGIGFALPIDIAKDIIYQILASGRVRRAWLGLNFQAIQDLEGVTGEGVSGALVRQVEPGSPASAAGVRPQDLLVSLDGVSVTGRFDDEIFELRHRIASIQVGRTVVAVLRRDGKEITVGMVPEELGASLGADKVYARWGLSVKEITPRMRRELYLDANGAFVTGVRGTAQQAGLQPNDVILKVGDRDVASLADLDRIYERMAREKIPHLKVQVRRGRVMHFASLRMAAARGDPSKAGGAK